MDWKEEDMKTTVSRIALASVIAASAPFSLQAQELEEIIITGVKTPIARDEMSTAVTVIGRDEIEARQNFQLADIIRDVAGLTVARSGSQGSQAQIRMRGSEANHVLVLIDGVEVNDPASGDEFLFEHLNAAEIERIEIIRGPQSALWGSDAVAGVINIITRQGADGRRVSARVEGGSFNTWRASANLSGSDGAVHYALGASHSSSDGTNVARTGNEDDGYENTTVQGRLGLTLSEGVKLDLTARHVKAENDFDPYDFFVTGLPVDGDSVTEIERTSLGAVLNLSSNERWTHKLGVNWFDSGNTNFVSGSFSESAGTERLKAFFESTVTVADGHRVTAAVEQEDTDFVQVGTATPWGDPNQNQSMSVTGYVLDYVGELTDATTLTASARRDVNSEFDDVTTWRLGASHQINKLWRVRASAGKGQKAPTFSERYGFFADVFLGNPNLLPETSLAWELGFEYACPEGDFRYTATYFNSELENEIDGFYYDAVNFAFTAINKDGKSNREGIELTAENRFSDAFTMGANYTYTKSEEPDGFGGTRDELRRPNHAANLFLDWSHENGGGVMANLSYVGEADDMFFPPWPQPSEVKKMKSYVLATVSARYRLTENVQLTARIENAFDEQYEDVYGFATPGLGAYAGLKVVF